MAAVIYLASTCSISFPAATPVAVIKTGVFFIFSDFSVISRCCLERHIHVPREPKPQTHPNSPFPPSSTWGCPNCNFSIFSFPTPPFLIWVLSLRTQVTDTQQKRAFYQISGISAFWMCYFWKFEFANKPGLLSWNWFTIPYRQHIKKLFWANYILNWFPSD